LRVRVCERQAEPAAGSTVSSCLGTVLLTFLLGLAAVGLLGAAAGAGSSSAAAISPGCQVSENFPSQVLQWCDAISLYAGSADLPADLVAALIWQESDGNPGAYSHSGAVGLMQVMPRDGIATEFMCKKGPCFEDRPTTFELQDPEYNIKYGTQLLSQLVVEQNGDYREALRAYGPMDVGYDFADAVLSLYQYYGAGQ